MENNGFYREAKKAMAGIKRVTLKNGRVRYRTQVQLYGFPSECKTFDRLTDARAWKSSREQELRLRRSFPEGVGRLYTVNQLIERYKNEYLPYSGNYPRYIKEKLRRLNWWKKSLGEVVLWDVNQFVINDAKALLAEHGLSASTVNLYLRTIAHCLNIAQHEWGLISQSPMRSVKRLPESRPRDRYLSDKEREAILAAAAKEHAKPMLLIIVLAISTGARKNEILGMKWRNVDMKRQCVTLEETKNGERRTLFLSGKGWEMFRQHARYRQGSYVFARRGSAGKAPIRIETEWRRIRKRAGVQDFRFHDLRHTAASYLAMNGASSVEIANVLGHKSLNMVRRYAHLSKGHTAQVVASMNAKIFGSGEQKQHGNGLGQ